MTKTITKGHLPFAIIFLSVLCLAPISAVPQRAPNYKIKTVVIDAGHGGKDPGCVGRKGEKNRNEATITLQIALKLGAEIKKNLPNVKVIYTRSTDTFIELYDRAGIANRNHADVFISIHCNSSPQAVSGSETYIMGNHVSEGNLDVAKRENSVILQEKDYQENYDGFNPKSPLAHIYFSNFQNAHMASSLRLADLIQSQFRDKTPHKSRGVRQAGFLVLWKTAMPSVLIETGYLTDKSDQKYLMSSKGQTQIAQAIFKAFNKYKQEIENTADDDDI